MNSAINFRVFLANTFLWLFHIKKAKPFPFFLRAGFAFYLLALFF